MSFEGEYAVSEPPRGADRRPVPRPVQGKMHHRTMVSVRERAHQAGSGSVLRHGGAHEPVKGDVPLMQR